MAFTDNFNRADENLEASANWTHDGLIAGAARIVSLAVDFFTADTAGSAYKCPDQGSADHYVQFIASTASYNSFICCRLTDRNNFVGLRAGSPGSQIYRRVGGTLTQLFNGAGHAAGSVFRLECSGTNWTFKVNGAQIATGAIGDASLTSTRQGLVSRSGAAQARIDNFEAGLLAGPVTGTLAATESGSDAASMAGEVLVSGSLSATESGSDTFSGSGGSPVQEVARQPGGGYYAHEIIYLDHRGLPVNRKANQAVQAAKTVAKTLPAADKPIAKEVIRALEKAARDRATASIAEKARELRIAMKGASEALDKQLRELERAAEEADDAETVSFLLMAL